MKLAVCIAFLGCVLYFSVPSVSQVQWHKKFEYKHSFRAPKLAQPDGSIPFWKHFGDAIASAEQLRLVPSMRSRKGAVWNTKPMTESEWWQADIVFRVQGQGRIGADGLAFWFTSTAGQQVGPVFGSNDLWNGLGLLFDSFDNDNQRNNPYIMLMMNDGTRAYNHQTDGAGQGVAGCQKDFRNKPYPMKARIVYANHVLTVMIHDGMTAHDRFELCLRAENIFLPRNGHFGLSAATGGLADDHDILSFSLWALHAEAPKQPAAMPEQEREQLQKKFEQQQQQYQEEREKFKVEHPDKVQPDDGEEEELMKWFEDATQRELRLIYEGQSNIIRIIQTLESKLERISQEQNSHTAMLNRVSTGGGGAVQPGQGGGGGDGLTRHEANELLQITRDVGQSVRDMKTYVNEVYTRTYNIEQKVQGGGVGSVQQAGATGDQYQMQQIRAFVEGIKVDVEHIRTAGLKGASAAVCPAPNCIAAGIFYGVVALQTALICALVLFRRPEPKSKFY